MTTPNIRELRRQRARRHARSPIGLRLLIVAASLYAIYLALGFFVAPKVIQGELERRASEQLNRNVTVGRVAFNPFNLSVRLEKVLVNDRDRQPLVGWASLYVNFQVFSLFADEIHFSEIELDGFAGRVAVSRDGVLNVADITAPARSGKPGKAWTVRIDRLAVNRAEFDYSDESRPEPFRTHLGPSTFVLREFRTSGGTGAPGVFSARTEAGESLQWTGRLALAPLRSNGEIRVEQVTLRKYAPFYSGRVGFDVLNGTMDAQVPYEFSIENNQPQVKITEASIQVKNVELATRGRSDPMVVLKAVDVGNLGVDLQKRSLEVNKIVFGGGRVAGRRDASGINLAMLAPPAGPASSPPTSLRAGGEAAWTAAVREISGKDFTVSFEDQTTPRTGSLEWTGVGFMVRHFSSGALANALPVEAHADLSPGNGTIKAEGTFALQPLAVDLSLAVQGAHLAAFSPWVESTADLRIAEGMGTIRARLRAAAGPDGSLALSGGGDVDVNLFSATDARGADLAKWKSLAVRGIEFTSKPRRLTVTEVMLGDPSLRLVMREGTGLNLASLRKAPSAPPAVGMPGAPGASAFMAIDRVALANASITYVDETLQPAVRTSVDELSGIVTGLTSAAIDRADVQLSGRVDGTAPFLIAGKMNVLSDTPALDLQVEIRNSDLSPLAPYVGKFVGYQLKSGGLSIDARARLANERLDSNANFVVTNFALGAPTNSPDAPKVPIQLALALLRDSEGKITLNVPIQGSLGDPSFKIGGVVARAIANVLTKAATSPFSLIGSVFGGGRSGEDLSFIDFAPGAAQMDGAAAQKTSVLARALRERPQLHLAIVGNSDPGVDFAHLRERELERRIHQAVFDQAKHSDPSLDNPDHVVVSPEAARYVIAEMYREMILRPQLTVIAQPAAKAEPEPAPKRRWFLVRWFTREKKETKPQVKPVPPAPPIHSVPLPPQEEMRRAVLHALPIQAQDLQRLAVERAERVRQAILQAGAAPEQVELAPASADAKAGTRVTLQLR